MSPTSARAARTHQRNFEGATKTWGKYGILGKFANWFEGLPGPVQVFGRRFRSGFTAQSGMP